MRALLGPVLLVLLPMTAGLAGGAGTGASSPASDSLSIEECIEMARANALEVRSASADLQSARYDSLAATRNRIPTASLFGNVLIAPRGFYDPTFTNLGQYELKAGITVPLLDGGDAGRARSRAANEAAFASYRLGIASRDAALRAGQIAAEILARREREHYEMESLAWIEDLANLISSRVRAGGSAPADSMRITLERDTVEAALDSTRTGLRAALRELAWLVSVPLEALPPISRPAPPADLGPTPADSIDLVDRVARRPDVATARIEEAQAQIDVAETRDRNDLRLGLSADAGFAGTDLTTWIPSEMRAADPNATFGDRLRQDLGASASIEFRRGLIDRTLAPATAARRSAAEAARLRTASALTAQERAALDLIDRWGTASRAFRKTSGTVARSEMNLLRTKSLYVAGAAGILDILDARRTLDDARERLVDARFRSRSARIEAEIVR